MAADVRKFSDIESVKACIEQHQRKTFTHFITYNKSRHFANEDYVHDLSRSRMHYWSHSGKVGVPIEYDGVPFLHVGRWTLICHQGKDLGARGKMKYYQSKKQKENEEGSVTNAPRRSTTKKLNCPAEIYVAHIVKYPQFKLSSSQVSKGSLPTEQQRRNVKAKLISRYRNYPSSVDRQSYYVVRLPRPQEHQGHPFVTAETSTETCSVTVSNASTLDRRKVNRNRDKQRRTREPMDSRVLKKLRELIEAGYSKTSLIRAQLNKFVIQELFDGRPPPPAMFRRYNPTSRDILNAVQKTRQDAQRMRCRQLRGYCSRVLQDIVTALPEVVDEASLAALYRQLTLISDTLKTIQPCSVSVQHMPQNEEDAEQYDVVTIIEDATYEKELY